VGGWVGEQPGWFCIEPQFKCVYLFFNANLKNPSNPPQLQPPLLQVHTSDIRGAGTDACVYVVLHGADGRRTDQLPLGDSVSHVCWWWCWCVGGWVGGWVCVYVCARVCARVRWWID